MRDVCLEVLRDVTESDAYGNLVLPRLLTQRRLSGRDAAFATELTYGTLRSLGQLDAVIERAANRDTSLIDPDVLDILRLGVYQILHTRVDDHAAVDTSVRLAKAGEAAGAAGFVNAVLRTVTRTPAGEWIDRIAPTESLQDLGMRHAHPAWIADVFNRALGSPDSRVHPELSAALEADNQRPHVHLAARPGLMTAEELALVTGGEEGRLSPYAVYLDGGDPGDLDPVREGLAGVQDEGSQLIGLVFSRAALSRQDQGRWLDMCAGPGGKAAFIGSFAFGADTAAPAVVDAVEVSEHRARLVRSSTRELPVRVHVGDSRHLDRVRGLRIPDGGFDRILVDAPCSGLGSLRRRPEARWRKSPDDIDGLVQLQRELLTSAISACAPGGVVVYSTCSPHPAETVGVVDAVAGATGATIENAAQYVPELQQVGAASRTSPFIQLWPHLHGTDAMFIAVLSPAAAEGSAAL